MKKEKKRKKKQKEIEIMFFCFRCSDRVIKRVPIIDNVALDKGKI